MFKCYKIKTYHNTLVNILEDKIIHSKCHINYLLLFINDKNRYGFLTSEKNIGKFIQNNNNLNIFPIFPDFIPSAVQMVIVKFLENSVNLIDIDTRFFLSAAPTQKNEIYDMLPSGITKAQNWEKFYLIEYLCKKTFFDNFCYKIETWYPLDFDDFERKICDLNINLFFLNLYFPIMGYKNLRLLAKLMLENNKIYLLISNLLTHDIFIKEGANLLKKQKEEYIYELKGNYEIFNKIFLFQKPKPISIGFVINSYIRKRISPCKKSAVVCTVRNEGPYLVEFVAYYLALGFDKIIIYSNNNDDNSDQLLYCLAKNGYIIYIKNNCLDSVIPQGQAYGHCLNLSRYILDFEWAFICDADEFLVLNFDLFSDVNDYLNFMNQRKTHQIAINWIYSWANKQVFWQDELIIKRFSYSDKDINRHIKTFIKPRFYYSSHPHFHITDFEDALIFRDCSGEIYKFNKTMQPCFSDEPKGSHAYLIHYWTKSLQEFILKLSRNASASTLSHIHNDDNVRDKMSLFLSKFNSLEENQLKNLKPIISNYYKMIENILSKKDIYRANNNVKNSYLNLLNVAIINFYKRFKNNDSYEIKQVIKLLKL